MKGPAGVGPVEDHRGREKGALVYPVFSRRSRGLSLGVNLFPDQKSCSFDCPYCEVFPFETGLRFDTALMEEALIETIGRAMHTPIRDICFSGNGEPTGSPLLFEALPATARIRERYAPGAALVLISNATGLLNDKTFEFLRGLAAGPEGLVIWLKLDAATPRWYAAINRSAVPHERLLSRIGEFAALAPVTIQTMLCTVGGMAPPAEESAAWERFVTGLAGTGGAGLRAVQLYGKARPAPEDPLAARLPDAYLEDRAASLRRRLVLAGRGSVPVEVYP
ncbi:MAG: hypothetical protein LBQ35_06485 [Spirochaetaceae bacterium]|jgi:histidinol dehydrogenase|nr:hypothetical protein [Spirochaetaceae bacterium]